MPTWGPDGGQAWCLRREDSEPRSPDAQPSLFPPNHTQQLRQLGLTPLLPHHRGTSAQAETLFPWWREQSSGEVAKDFLSFIWAGQRLACLRCETRTHSQLFCSRSRSRQAGAMSRQLGKCFATDICPEHPSPEQGLLNGKTKKGCGKGARMEMK